MAKSDILKEHTKNNYDAREDLHGVVSRENFEFLGTINKQTVYHLGEQWARNIQYNKKYWRMHKPLISCKGMGINKAVIGVGASPSFHKNKHVLKEWVNRDGVKDWDDRDFITICANHQYKPLLQMGIIPDFVLLVDASDVVLDQLTKDIPKDGQNTILITGVHCSPKVIKTWSKQGRDILFFVSPAPDVMAAFRSVMNRSPDPYKIELGGNVLNGAWMISIAILNSTVFMGVGNDLSFPMKDTLDERRSAYYADGDYSSNAPDTGTGRDEAASEKIWAGFSMSKRKIMLLDDKLSGMNRYNFELDLVGTSHTLWVYKNWLEVTLLSQCQQPVRFNYFNCTEGGILGVMSKAGPDNAEAMKDKNNWYMFDDACINKHTKAPMYHTAMLEDAIDVFNVAKEKIRWQIKRSGHFTPARYADHLVPLS
jgi:hypothetical protein